MPKKPDTENFDPASRYNHREAFCLMEYACDNCGHITKAWNSRDGVTPFCFSSPCCEGHLSTHVNWQHDTHYFTLPQSADFVFLDCTMDKAREAAAEWLENIKAADTNEFFTQEMKDVYLKNENIIEERALEIFGQGGSPDMMAFEEFQNHIKLEQSDG